MRLRVVTARTGTQWVREGLKCFGRVPMAFFSLLMMSLAAMVLLASLPLVGGVLALMVAGPVLSLLMMAAAERTVRNGTASTAEVFQAALLAVRERARPLALLGALYAASVLAMGALSTLIAGDPFARLIDEQGTPRVEVIQSIGFQAALLLRMALYLPVALAFWHAPALVHWHAVPPVKSLFFSIVTCLRNMGAMTLFGVVWAGVVMLAGIALNLVAGILIAAVGAKSLAIAVMAGGSMVMTAMFMASTWFSFRDCFDPD